MTVEELTALYILGRPHTPRDDCDAREGGVIWHAIASADAERVALMFIRRFSIRNFKIHRDTSLDLFPITVFVGPNSRRQVCDLRCPHQLFSCLSGGPI